MLQRLTGSAARWPRISVFIRSFISAVDASTARTTLGAQTADAQLFSNIPQNSKSVDYTLVLTDGERHILHPASDANSRTFTIPSNASVAFPIGTAITFANRAGNTCSIAITTDTMVLAGTGTTGTRTLGNQGLATAMKVESTVWFISGSGLT